MTSVSFKSKYIAVAVVAAILVSLAVGGVLMYENRVQHSALLGSTAADSRNRLAGELGARAGDLARHVSERVADGVLHGDREIIRAEVELFQRDDTLLGVLVRDVAGTELYAWRRDFDTTGMITRSSIAPVRTHIESAPGISTPQTIGEIEVEIRSREASPETAAARIIVRALVLLRRDQIPGLAGLRALGFSSVDLGENVDISFAPAQEEPAAFVGISSFSVLPDFVEVN